MVMNSFTTSCYVSTLSLSLSLSLCVCVCVLGPLYMGELIQGTYGFVWTHGVYVSGHFIPGSMTYMHSTIEVPHPHTL